jgi:hypothetical protein
MLQSDKLHAWMHLHRSWQPVSSESKTKSKIHVFIKPDLSCNNFSLLYVHTLYVWVYLHRCLTLCSAVYWSCWWSSFRWHKRSCRLTRDLCVSRNRWHKPVRVVRVRVIHLSLWLKRNSHRRLTWQAKLWHHGWIELWSVNQPACKDNITLNLLVMQRCGIRNW